jgi:antitoxin component YwqK of YwqJK toxin-antitoxin module
MLFKIIFFLATIFSFNLFYSQNIPLNKVTNIERDTIYSKVDVGLVTGVVTDFFKNGNIKIYAEFKDGLRNGEFKKWHSSGQIIYSGKFINGKKNGVFIKNDIYGKNYQRLNTSKILFFGKKISQKNTIKKTKTN